MKKPIHIIQVRCFISIFQFLPLFLYSQWVMVDSLNSAVIDINSSGGLLYACTATTGVFVSSDSGFTFNAINNGLNNLNTRKILIRDSMLFLGTNNSIYKSTNFGNSWELSNTGIPLSLNSNVDDIAFRGDSIIIATFNNGIFLSKNFGLTWTPMNIGLPDLNKEALLVIDNLIFTGSGYISGSGIFISEDFGFSWDPRNNGVPADVYITSFSNIGQTIFASTHGHGVLKTDDNGMNWTAIYPPYWYIWSTYSFGNTLLTGHDGVAGIYKTDDLGNTWQAMNEGLNYSLWDKNIRTIYNFGPYIYIGTWSNKIFRRPCDQLITGVQNINKKNNLEIYPNPITEHSKFLIDLPSEFKYDLEIFNSLGKCLLKIRDFNPGQFELCKFDYSSGIYFYRISKSNQVVFTGKFIVI